MTDYVEKKKNRKGPDGAVIIEPRNFLTNPPKKGEVGKGTSFRGTFEHLPDPFDRKKELLKKERLEHESKVQEKPFSQRVKPRSTFGAIKEVFGSDVPLPPVKEKEPPSTPPPGLHDKPFKPSNPPKKGYNKTLDKFPKYVEDPLKFVQRKKPVEGEEEKPNFRPTHNVKTMPVNPVATNYRNLKSEFPSIFRRF